MANVNLYRGGMPEFKAMFCAGDYASFKPPFSSPHVAYTPPYDSHADAAHGQGYLNLHFPLVPNLAGTSGHNWMREALKGLSAVNDVIFTNWVPLRSYVEAMHIEVTKTDATLEGVYIAPVAYRVSWDFTTEDWKSAKVADFDAAVTAAGVTKFPLGTPQGGDDTYAFIQLYPSADPTKPPCTFGHDMVTRTAAGVPNGGLDEYFGAVVLGYNIVEGDADKIKAIHKSDIVVHMSAKLFAFEGSTQVG